MEVLPVTERIKRSPHLFMHKEHATLEQCVEILNWHHQNGANQTKMARHFDKIYPNLQIKQPLVSLWLKEESKW